MRPLYDFGLSQEDPLTELDLLRLRQGDNLLSIASGGEVPLTILSLVPDIRITAVDISETQLALCRLKLLAATTLSFPANGEFLGYAYGDSQKRRQQYLAVIYPLLSQPDQQFWGQHIDAIEKGVIHFGRFEGYIRWIRKALKLMIGRKNLRQLLDCDTILKQQQVFDEQIGTRKAIQYLFRIAFHPAVYKNRGLDSAGLRHARSNTGDIFFHKFRNFCTTTP
ncbi:MAG TPA: DUF3419 family protein, partial [Saprospiraceae bacterium]|nr:DUF3419 family protein [Saprospiraceae bacterium]